MKMIIKRDNKLDKELKLLKKDLAKLLEANSIK